MTVNITADFDTFRSQSLGPILKNSVFASSLMVFLPGPSFPAMTPGEKAIAEEIALSTASAHEPAPTSIIHFEAHTEDASRTLGSGTPATEPVFDPYDPPFVHSFFERRMMMLKSLSDGWQGPGSLAAADETIDDAFVLLKRLVTDLPDAPEPKIGLDSDGYIVLSWKKGRLVGNLSVFGDGTFSYYLEKDTDVAKDNEANVASPLPRKLSNILNA